MNTQLAINVFIASLATVGLEEFIKNFLKPKNTIWYALLMLPLSICCFCAVIFLPVYIIGSLLTIGCVQLCYQTLVQGFKSIVSNMAGKVNTVQNCISEIKPVVAPAETKTIPGK